MNFRDSDGRSIPPHKLHSGDFALNGVLFIFQSDREWTVRMPGQANPGNNRLLSSAIISKQIQYWPAEKGLLIVNFWR